MALKEIAKFLHSFSKKRYCVVPLSENPFMSSSYKMINSTTSGPDKIEF